MQNNFRLFCILFSLYKPDFDVKLGEICIVEKQLSKELALVKFPVSHFN
jgi:hypothetical protein